MVVAFEHLAHHPFRDPFEGVGKEKEPSANSSADSTEPVNKVGYLAFESARCEEFVRQIPIGFRERVLCPTYRAEVVVEPTSSDPSWTL